MSFLLSAAAFAVQPCDEAAIQAAVEQAKHDTGDDYTLQLIQRIRNDRFYRIFVGRRGDTRAYIVKTTRVGENCSVDEVR